MTVKTDQPNLTSDEALSAATGRHRDEWFADLDAWGAAERSHRDIDAWLMNDQDLDNWWAQTLTVDYERARGLRPVGGGRDGLFRVTASRTVHNTAERVLAAVTDPTRRAGWLPDAAMRPRPTTAEFIARFDWADDGTRVVFGVAVKDEDRCVVAVQHERLPSADVADDRRAYWRDRLGALKAFVEG
jgi:hypothetical protein